MESKLIIIRGNSGSGKTTIAKKLQHHLGHGTLLIAQDVVRRDMLKVHDREGNLSIELIRQIAEYGKGRCEVVIVEGILYASRYGAMLKDLIHFYDQKAKLIILIYLLRKPLFVIILAPKKMTSGKILYVLGGIRMIILGWMVKRC